MAAWQDITEIGLRMARNAIGIARAAVGITIVGPIVGITTFFKNGPAALVGSGTGTLAAGVLYFTVAGISALPLAIMATLGFITGQGSVSLLQTIRDNRNNKKLMNDTATLFDPSTRLFQEQGSALRADVPYNVENPGPVALALYEGVCAANRTAGKDHCPYGAKALAVVDWTAGVKRASAPAAR